MSRFYYSRFVFTALLLLSSIACAVNSEYKNSLEGIELQKTSESGYNINLYTKNGYSEPVKVIKKNDLSYYILLPETKNVSVPTKFKTSEIQNIDTKIYPYAGVDVNNGYTKIDINTTKAIDFNLKIKASNNSVSGAKPQVVAKKIQEQPAIKEQVKTTKTDISSKTAELKPKTTTNTKLTQNQVKKNTETIQDKNNTKSSINKTKTTNSKITANNTGFKKTTRAIKTTDGKIASRASKPVSKELVAKKKIEKKVEDTYVDENKYDAPVENIETPQELKEPDKLDDFLNRIEKKQNKELLAQNNDSYNDDLENLDEYAYAAKLPDKESLIVLLQEKFNLVQSKLADYNLGIFDILLMLITGLIGFFVVLFIMSNRQNNTSKRKADIFGENVKSSLVPKKNSEDNVKDNGQYFVFDKNVKQTGLLKPTTSDAKKNYELSTYDPDIRIDYNNQVKNNDEGSSEYDIIQKILKEDVYVDIEPAQAETITKEKIETRVVKNEEMEESIQKSNIVTSPIGQEKEIQQKQEEETTQSELTVLSKTEIAPERGFMCVSYENNVSLIGYIFDDIFVLHNFKKPELDNYEIQSRLSERDISSSLYIVKVAEEKMIIRVSNKSMKLEITL